MTNRSGNLLARFGSDRRGNVAVMFGIAAIPLLYFVGAAVDYQAGLRDKTKLQNGADNAALALASQMSQYYQKNSAYPPNAMLASYQTQASSIVAAQTGNFGSVASGNVSICTPTSGQCSVTVNGATTALSNGQVFVRATGTQSRVFGGITSMGPSSMTIAANSTAAFQSVSNTTTAPSPVSVDIQFQYAKGAYYKVVTLWLTPVGAKTPLPMVTWTYQPTNLSVVAIPPPAMDAILVANSGFPANPVDTGIGMVLTAWNTTNAASVGATVNQTTNQITFNQAYDNLYMTMDVVDQQCAPGMVLTPVSQSASSANQAFYNTWYYNAGTVTETVSCQTPAANSGATPLTSWSLHVSTDPTAAPSTTNSNFIFENGVELPANQIIPLSTAFPCPSNSASGQSVTNYWAWESMNPTVGDRDFFFTVTTACSTGNWTGAQATTSTATTPVLLR